MATTDTPTPSIRVELMKNLLREQLETYIHVIMNKNVCETDRVCGVCVCVWQCYGVCVFMVCMKMCASYGVCVCARDSVWRLLPHDSVLICVCDNVCVVCCLPASLPSLGTHLSKEDIEQDNTNEGSHIEHHTED